MIVFAAIVPCSPLLMPSVNPERVGAAGKTRAALTELAEELFAAKPDTLVLFCDHGNTPPDAFAINVADPYHASLAEFGDLGYSKTYGTDFMLADAIQRAMRHNGQPVTLETEKELPFSATVPLAFLTEHLPNIRVLPIAPCNASAKHHFDFGYALRDSLVSSSKRIAVIACGDGSHARSADAPSGLHEDGEKLDTLIATLVAHQNAAGLLQINEALRTNAQDASYRQILMLFGTLDEVPLESTVLSQEAPFGVGQLVAELRLH